MGIKITGYKYDIIQRALRQATGENIFVYGNRESDKGEPETWGVNWSAMGTVSPDKAMRFAENLKDASRLAELLTNACITNVDWSLDLDKVDRIADVHRCVEIFCCYLNTLKEQSLPHSKSKAFYEDKLTDFLCAPPAKTEIVIPQVNGMSRYDYAKESIRLNPGFNPGEVLEQAMTKGDSGGRILFLTKEEMQRLQDETKPFSPSIDELYELEQAVSLRISGYKPALKEDDGEMER